MTDNPMPTPTDRVLNKLDELGAEQSSQGNDISVIKAALPNFSQQLADHERRLRSLEARLWYATGVVGLLAVAAPVVSQWLQSKP